MTEGTGSGPRPEETDNSMEAAGQFAGVVAAELGAAASLAMAVLGDRLGLFEAMAVAGPLTPSELAARSGCAERYIREWLCSQAAGGWVHFDVETERFELPASHAAALVDEASPTFLAGSIQLLNALYASVDRLAETFRTGEGIGWGEHHSDLHGAVGRFSRTLIAPMLPSWIDASGEPAGRLQDGGRILDLGCGHGSVLLALAHAYPDARLDGVDSHAASVEVAQDNIVRAGFDHRVAAHVADAGNPPAGADGCYDLVLLVDSLHDMGDPVAAATAARRALAPGGAVLIVEPVSSDRQVDNFNPVGRYYYAISTAFCLPAALSQAGGWALGNQSGPSRVVEICRQAGLATVVAQEPTPFNMVFTARP